MNLICNTSEICFELISYICLFHISQIQLLAVICLWGRGLGLPCYSAEGKCVREALETLRERLRAKVFSVHWLCRSEKNDAIIFKYICCLYRSNCPPPLQDSDWEGSQHPLPPPPPLPQVKAEMMPLTLA